MTLPNDQWTGTVRNAEKKIMKIITIQDFEARQRLKTIRRDFSFGWHGEKMLIQIQGNKISDGNIPEAGIVLEAGKKERRVKL